MPLTPGTSIGPYEIVAPIGAGGMGEVYRARDTKLNRDVALKILPDMFAGDPDRFARFTREAQTLAALNHPNIAHIHGLEEGPSTGSGQAAMRALVMELVEGEDLAQLIARGKMSLDEALPIARQIAEALEAAHEKGVIHRDLKPANIKVTPDGQVKVLDFGLAKLAEVPAASSAAGLSQSPTITTPAMMTGVGTILGTAGYMSPEQAKGRPADKRSDIWAFGCVLFEMLTGQRAFGGEDVSDTLANVLKTEPDWKVLPSSVPAHLRTVLTRCLDKNRQTRFADISIVSFLLNEGAEGTAVPARVSNRRAIIAGAGLIAAAVVLTAGVVWLALRPAPMPPRAVTRFSIGLPPNVSMPFSQQPFLALAPDGGRLVYVGVGGAANWLLFSRAIDQLDSVPIRGTDGGTHPFFSPNGQWVGFNSVDGKLKKIPVSGGAAVTLCNAVALRGATWLTDDSIVFSTGTSPGLWRVSAAGGTPEQVTKLDGQENRHQWPEVLPGGKAIVFMIQRVNDLNSGAIGLLRLDTRERRVLIEDGMHPHYLPSGHLVFGRAGDVLAVPFDLQTLQVKGTPVSVIERVLTNQSQGSVQFTASGTGSIAYVPGTATQGSRAFVWIDRHGQAQPVSAPRRNYEFPRVSPDGRRVAVRINSPSDSAQDIWLYELTRGTLSRLTSNANDSETPVWTPDGKRVTYAVTGSNPARQIVSRLADGSGGDEVLAGSDRHLHLGGWSPRGDALIAMATDAGNMWVLQMEGKRALRPLLQTPYLVRAGTISPDGMWLAYASNETNRFEIYVQPFPGLGAKYQISSDGGTEPIWAKSGRELFYRDGDKMMAVAVDARRGSLERGTPTLLFQGAFAVSTVSGGDAWYDVSPDGQRFLMLKTEEAPASAASIVMVQEWTNELKRLAPAK